jgi:hypothetical protein
VKQLLFYFKYKIKFYTSPALWDFFSKFLKRTSTKKYSQQFMSFGTLNPTVTFFVIRRRPPGWGFFSNVLYVLQGIIYAQEKNYIPIVDMENYWMSEIHSLKKINGTNNAWCYLFNQVSNFSLQEVYSSKNVVLSDAQNILSRSHWLTLNPPTIFESRTLLEDTGKIISKYIKLNEVAELHYSDVKEQLLWNPKKTLGVFVRGTGYYDFIPSAATQLPSFDHLVSEITDTLLQNELSSLYISTEDYRVYLRLCQSFEKYSIIPSIKFQEGLTIESWLSTQKLTYDNGVQMGYQNSLKYLTEIMLLSECENLVVTPSNASAFALARSNLAIGDHRVLMKNRVIKVQNL